MNICVFAYGVDMERAAGWGGEAVWRCESHGVWKWRQSCGWLQLWVVTAGDWTKSSLFHVQLCGGTWMARLSTGSAWGYRVSIDMYGGRNWPQLEDTRDMGQMVWCHCSGL